MSALNSYIDDNKYESYSKFKSVEEFNNHFEQAMIFHKDKFTKSEYIALNKLRKFAYSKNSPKTIGVAWSKAQKVVAATHKDMIFGISRSTFDRMLRKAKRLNIVTVIHQFRKNKYQKHSVYVFNRVEDLTPDTIENDRIVSKSNTIEVREDVKTGESITMLLKLPVFKDLKTYPQAESVADQETNVIDFEENKTEYQQLDQKIDGLFTDKKITYKLYGVWLSIRKIADIPFSLCIQSLHSLILEIKRRIAKDMKPLRNPAGYFKGILKNKADVYLKQQIQNHYDTDWKNAPKIVDELNNKTIQNRFAQFRDYLGII